MPLLPDPPRTSSVPLAPVMEVATSRIAPPLPPPPGLLPPPPLPPLVAEISMVPAMLTFPVARNATAVLAALRVNRTVTPDGTVTVVKLKRPVAGRASVVFVVGLNAPSAPVLPLLNVCARTGPAAAAKAPHRAIATVGR